MLWSQRQEVPTPRLQFLPVGQKGKDPSQPGEETPPSAPIQIPSPAGTQPAGRERTEPPPLTWGRRRYQTVNSKNEKKKKGRKERRKKEMKGIQIKKK